MLKISAVVVTYNRKDLLAECINALLNQTYPLTSIIVVDNASNDGTEELLKNRGYLQNETASKGKVEYRRLHENIGGAGGFAAGMKEAAKQNPDYTWVMDDDAEPEKDCLRILAEYLEQHPDQGAVAPLKILPGGKALLNHRGSIDLEHLFSNVIRPVTDEELSKSEGSPIRISHSSFVGLMVAKEVVATVGYPREDFFIYYDDLEYNIRINRKFGMVMIPESRIIHKERVVSCGGNGNKKRFLWLTSNREVKYKDLWRSYYSLRNRLYLAKKYQTDRIALVSGMISCITRSVIGTLLFDDHKYVRLKLLAMSVLHGLRGKLGKTLDPQAWMRQAE